MINKYFHSTNTKDQIEITYFKKSHKSNLHIKTIEDVSENIKLVGDAILFLKNNGIQWICVALNNHPKIPENAVWFKHEKTGNICCHVEDFENFYLQNLINVININHIHINATTDLDDNGWTLVVDKRKLRKNKLQKIKTDINNLVTNWNDL